MAAAAYMTNVTIDCPKNHDVESVVSGNACMDEKTIATRNAKRPSRVSRARISTSTTMLDAADTQDGLAAAAVAPGITMKAAYASQDRRKITRRIRTPTSAATGTSNESCSVCVS